MITVDKYEEISREDFIKNCLNKDGTAAYIVSGINLKDIACTRDNLNSFLVDNIVEDGYLLGDISFKFVGFRPHDNTVKIEVSFGEIEEYLVDNAEEIF